MSRRRSFTTAEVAGILVALAALVLGWTWWISRDRVAPETRSAVTTAGLTAIEQGVAGAADTHDLPPVPPAQAPIDLAAADLMANADAGSVRATCRLAFELLRCRELVERDRWRATQAPPRRRGDPAADAHALKRYEEQMLKTAQDAMVCERVPKAVQDRAEDLLAMAARQGVPGAMLHYATGRHLSHDAGFAATPAFDAWLRDAPAMLHAARDAGLREAVPELVTAYSTEIGFPGALIPDDPVQALAHRILGALLVEGLSTEFEMFTRNLDPEDVRKARELANYLHQRHFGGRRHPPSPPDPNAVAMPLPDPDSYCRPAA